ncbi:hypothetical protein [Fictibacillus fluitans]|uniref:Spore germination protein n=1 Tax=Fictibacillus fluitans TaxID=3058422 RepID=A0ABT8I0Z3_9BACL|nr:hypothetical protein [Fictibacillus sp. NE201]MDN4526708.1 hypothetical protein [Fictibacillus sp. NE201]
MPVSVVFNQININNQEGNAAVAAGQNNQPDWTAIVKINHGNGAQIGISFTAGNLNTVFDNDVTDTPVAQPEFGNPQPTSQI